MPKASRSAKYVWPTINYSHPNAESITGGYVYRGQDYPALVGTYMFADFEKGWIGGIRLRAPAAQRSRRARRARCCRRRTSSSSFGVDERGELYLVDYRGAVFQVTGVPK